ncbi:response regulator [Halarcobacter sp.]|uniref:response regulator n=1 Tax=Halarcobacter sp. TaxID=2321133 RepID=UPI002AA63316|nr:response regulator [Halarcobacter sp.]|eukprot:Anaeramoba_ignava/a349197_30.p3 GENE.a349197_30~~a349197_30.p3  ORF type:complete len:130 (-),score=16.84 a349197_30:1586-1975(-)
MQEKIEKLKRLKLLFVEDETDLVEIITDTLQKLNANFLSAKNGQEALDIIEANDDIDIIVTDINMPVMNGLVMIKELRDKGNSIPIIIMSAHTETDYINKAKELGVDNYLLKPFDFIKFIDLITEMEIK